MAKELDRGFNAELRAADALFGTDMFGVEQRMLQKTQVTRHVYLPSSDDGVCAYCMQVHQDDLDFARETLGPNATEAQVIELAAERSERDFKETT